MHPITVSMPALAVSVIYSLWHAYRVYRWQRERLLRERVAFMLWTMAQQMG